MSRHVIIVGGMASGKTALAKEFEKRGFRRIVTYTTRPIREGEVDDTDYHFVNFDDFLNMVNGNEMAEWEFFSSTKGMWLYGSAKCDYISEDDTVVVLTSRGVEQLQNTCGLNGVDIIFLDINKDNRIKRALDRGDDPEEVEYRMKREDLTRNGKATMVITNPNVRPEEIAEWFISQKLHIV